MEVTERNITERLLYDVLYEYLRKCGLGDEAAVNLALDLQSKVGYAAEQAGGDTKQVPEE